jgi:hypothetical protein
MNTIARSPCGKRALAFPIIGALAVSALLASVGIARATPRAGDSFQVRVGNDTYVVLRDHKNPRLFWYQPPRLRLVERKVGQDKRALATLLTYSYNKSAQETVNKGLLQLTMTGAQSLEDDKRLKAAIAKETKRPVNEIKISPIRPVKGSVRIYSDAGDLISEGDRPVGIRSGDNALTSELPFTVPLSEVGAMVYEPMMISANGGPIVHVDYEYRVQVEGMKIIGSFDVDLFMKHRSSDTKMAVEVCGSFMGFGGSTSVEGQWQEAADKMTKSGILKWECHGGESEELAKLCAPMLKDFVKNAYAEMAKLVMPKKTDPAAAKDPSVSTDCGFIGAEAAVGVSWASKKESLHQSSAFKMLITGSAQVKRNAFAAGQPTLRDYLKVPQGTKDVKTALIQQARDKGYFMVAGPGPFTTALLALPDVSELDSASIAISLVHNGQVKAQKAASYRDGAWATPNGQPVGAFSFPVNSILGGPPKPGKKITARYEVTAKYGSPAIVVSYKGEKQIMLEGNGGTSGQDLLIPSASESMSSVRVDGSLLSFRKLDPASPLELITLEAELAGGKKVTGSLKPIMRDGAWSQPEVPFTAWSATRGPQPIKLKITFKKVGGEEDVKELTAERGETIDLLDSDFGYISELN